MITFLGGVFFIPRLALASSLFGLTLLYHLYKRRPLLLSSSGVWLGFYYLSGMVSALLNPFPKESLYEGREIYVLLILSLALYYLPKIPRKTIQLLLAGMLFYLSLYGVIGALISHQTTRWHGPVSHYMTYAGLLVLLLGLLIPAWDDVTEKTFKAILALLLCMGCIALLFTLTRNGWVGLMGGSILYGVIFKRPYAFIIPTLFLLLAFAIPFSRARLLSFLDLKDPTARDRWAMWSAGVDIFQSHPWVGIGPGNVKRLYPWYKKPFAVRHRVPHLHSNPIHILAERGLAGLVAYLGFLFTSLREAMQKRKSWEGQAAVFALIAISLAGLFEYNFGDTEVLLLTLITACLPYRRSSSP